MNDNFDQHARHRPRPSTGSRHAAQSGGKTRSRAAHKTVRTVSVARLADADRVLAPENITVQRYRRAMRKSPARAATS